LIVVDDGSTDDTALVIQNRSRRDDRVKVITQANSGRPSVARNRGMQVATGDVIAFLDGDDQFLPSRLKRVVEQFVAHPDVDLVFHDVLRIDEAGKALQETYLGKYNFRSSAGHCLMDLGEQVYLGTEQFYNYMCARFSPLLMCATAVRRSRLERESVWFREDMRCGEDVELWFRIVRSSRIAYIDLPLATYRFRRDSTTRDEEGYLVGVIRALLLNLERAREALSPAEFNQYRRRIADRHRYLAYVYFRQGHNRRARQSLHESFRAAPRLRILPFWLKTFVPAPIVRRIRRFREA
jgi:glycosyltransferase involved in cell wall biosynthesis